MDDPPIAGAAAATRHRVGTLEELRRAGCLTTKIGSRPVCVFWDGERAFAVDDRCPHMGFPLHRGTVEEGLLTCHWHHARFDLASGGTLDPFADDVMAYPVELTGGEIHVLVAAPTHQVAKLRHRLDEGLEQGITLVIAKAVLGLLEAGLRPDDVVEAGVSFGTSYRAEGWGSGLTVLVAMANVLPHLDDGDRALALVHGLSFLSGDTMGHAPRFALAPLEAAPPAERLTEWYRRFVDTRSSDAAERSLVTAVVHHEPAAVLASMMVAAITDHVLIDEGHVLDFTNKAFECLGHIGWDRAAEILPTLVRQTAGARRHEEESAWRHPEDLAAMLEAATSELPARLARAGRQDWADRPTRASRVARAGAGATPEAVRFADSDVDRLAWAILAEDPSSIVTALDRAIDDGASLEQLARAVAYAAALRLVRFHTQNDHADWDVVHHAFTAANAAHQCVVRAPSPEVARGIYQCALRVYLDRFLNVPAARLPAGAGGSGGAGVAGRGGAGGVAGGGGEAGGAAAGGGVGGPVAGGGVGGPVAGGGVGGPVAGGGVGGPAAGGGVGGPAAGGGVGGPAAGNLDDLQACWDSEGRVDEAGRICYRHLASGGDPARLIAVLGRALLAEDPGFHWYQVYEAAVRQHSAWPAGSEQGMLVLVGAARFLAAHTPTRRELSQVFRIATRLRRGEPLYEEEEREDGTEPGAKVAAPAP